MFCYHNLIYYNIFFFLFGTFHKLHEFFSVFLNIFILVTPGALFGLIFFMGSGFFFSFKKFFLYKYGLNFYQKKLLYIKCQIILCMVNCASNYLGIGFKVIVIVVVIRRCFVNGWTFYLIVLQLYCNISPLSRGTVFVNLLR